MNPDLPTEHAAESSEPRSPKALQPTYAPFLLALGVTMLFWGLATSPVMSAAGFALFVWALSMWIREIAQAWRN